jgi:hypothetical protein
MADQPETASRDRERFAGFSSMELLRRARVLRDIAESDPLERRRLERLASDHEEAARLVRRKESAEDA